MSRGGSTDPFYRALDEATAMGPGVREILSTPLRFDDSALAKEGEGDEDYVRRFWQEVRYDGHRVLAKCPSGGEWILSGNPNCLFESSHHLSTPKAWAAARRFTEECLGGISIVDAEIDWTMSHVNDHPAEGSCTCAGHRVLQSKREEVAALRQGMK
jgi:hypothetical protein